MGASEETVLSKYGEPYERIKDAKTGETLFKYKVLSSINKYSIVNMLLVISMRDDKVISISLAGDKSDALKCKEKIENTLK